MRVGVRVQWLLLILTKTIYVFGAVHRGSRPDRSTTAARELAKSFFNLIATPQDCRKTSLDELDEVEKHLNKKQIFKDWLGICVYEPERVEDGEVVWHLRRKPPAKLTNILTIGIYEGHAFVIKDISKLMHVFIAVQDLLKLATFNGIPKRVRKGRRLLIVRQKKLNYHKQLLRRFFIQNIHLLRNLFVGLKKNQHFVKFTFTTLLAVMEVKDGLSVHL